MGAQESVVNVCCREDKGELSYTRFNVYRDERNRYLLDSERKGSRTVSASKWKPLQHSNAQKQYEICCERACGCGTEGDGQRSLMASADNGSRGGINEAFRSGTDRKRSVQKQGDQNETDENHPKTPPPPPGWTESEILLLKRAVENAARVQRVKPPNFAAMQAIHGSMLVTPP